jgi:SAM-dependent methyltransferase
VPDAELSPPGRPVEASVEVVDCLRALVVLPQWQRLLVVSVEPLDDLGRAQAAPACTMYRLPETVVTATASTHDPWLPFDDGAFDLVLLYRATRHKVDIELLLGEANRVLQPDGRVVVLEHEIDFAFAPLPESGPAHLLHGWLRQAGFAHVDLAGCAGTRVVAVAHA